MLSTYTREPHQGYGNSLSGPTAPDHCRCISLPVQQEALHSLAGFFLPNTSQLEYTHKYFLLKKVCMSLFRDFQIIHQELTSTDTWKRSWGVSKHWAHQRQGPCPREVIPQGQWLKNLSLNNLASHWAERALIARFGLFKLHRKKQFWWFFLWSSSLKYCKTKQAWSNWLPKPAHVKDLWTLLICDKTRKCN